MIFTISKFIASLFGLDITKVQKAVLLAVMIGAVIAVIALGVWLFFGNGRNDRNDQLEKWIEYQKGVNSVITNQINAQQKEVNNASKNTNQALGDLGNSVNRDSSTFNGDGAGDRFCRDFPNDSSCQH